MSVETQLKRKRSLEVSFKEIHQLLFLSLVEVKYGADGTVYNVKDMRSGRPRIQNPG